MHIEFKNLCNASKHMNMHISNAINQSSWACPLLVCFSCPRILIHLLSSMLLPLCPCPTSTSLSQSLPKLSYLISPPCTISISRISYLCIISPPLSSISIKGVLLIDAKVWIWGRWLRLWILHFLWTSLECWNDTTCILCRASRDTTHRIFDLDIN